MPLMVAGWALSARRKSIPRGPAARGEIFWILAGRAEPAVRRRGLPLAERAADALEVGSFDSARQNSVDEFG